MASNVQSSQYDITVVFNTPSENVDTSQYDATALIERQGEDAPVEVSQYDVIAIVRGRIFNPRLRVWWFELDAHEYYCLNLGANGKTLIYDLTTGAWSWWATADLNYWRAAIGTQWTQSGNIAFEYGSSVVVGDDTAGILWVLDPLQGYDDPANSTDRENGVIIPFTRKATGQVLTRGRITIPCYQTYLVADPGVPAYAGATVTLSYSDDGGNTFVDASTPIVAEAGNYYQEFVWRSIGLVRAPGRLFRVTDDGAFPQIDELTIYDNSTA
jgi:hypothetical protein